MFPKYPVESKALNVTHPPMKNMKYNISLTAIFLIAFFSCSLAQKKRLSFASHMMMDLKPSLQL